MTKDAITLLKEDRAATAEPSWLKPYFYLRPLLLLSWTSQLWLSNLLYMQISFLLSVPEGWDCTVCLHTIVCVWVRENESFLSAISPSIGPLDLIQHQLKRVTSNWRHRSAINLPSILWTCHTASFLCPLPIPRPTTLETWCWADIFFWLWNFFTWSQHN